ncbi:hypothetical protein HOR75_gp62 [Shewanella phage SppYZU05]|uniref:Uncharacterized protein n=1 Tax=Shewanella phage SppYZU05 TaxID=1970795 RepID=A0A1W6JTI9_9CAUD|nr:hypothetical protein HOR75_gp62 [Shewanella phage SppYZU05]ARM70588.1 hypothetical protein SppYZU05_62 [Shewanella phage SppYZU05]
MTNVTNFATIAFTTEQQERLERTLIGHLDSGTLSEEQAMALNVTSNIVEFRNVAREVQADVTIVQNIVDFVFDNLPAIDWATLDMNPDMSEYFVCENAEQANNLRSWAELFGCEPTIKPKLTVITNVAALINTIANGTLEDAVKADQAMRDMPAQELQAGLEACSTDEITYALMRWDEVEASRPAALEKSKKFEMTAEQKELSKGFKAVVEAKQGLTSSMISLENIEAKSATSLATAIIHALEKEGFYTQWLPTMEDGTPYKHYLYSAKSANFDSRSVAVLAVQLAGILPYIDRPIAMADVAAVAVFRRRMRDIARANRFIPNMYHESIDKTEHWHAKLEAALDMAIRGAL